MTIISIIHLGSDLGGKLAVVLHEMRHAGITPEVFMDDVVSVLKHRDEFDLDKNQLLDELLYGFYYHHHLSGGGTKQFDEKATRFLEDAAIVCKNITNQLHTVLVEKGLYNTDGTFPYAFHSFNGTALSMRSL